jgi:F-type H+-transporting ATPase subunit b
MAEKTLTVVEQSTGHGRVFPPLDKGTYPSQLFWLAITFGLLYLLVRRFILPLVGEVVEYRSKHIERDLGLTEKLKNEAATALANYNQALEEARSRANDIGKEMRERLALEAKKDRARVDAHIATMLSDAEKHIAETKSKALASLDEIASDVAKAVVSRLIDSEVTTDEIKRALMQRAAE